MAGNASALVTVVSAAVLHRRVALLPAEDQVLFPVQVAWGRSELCQLESAVEMYNFIWS